MFGLHLKALPRRQGFRYAANWGVIALATGVIGGCTVVDSFGPRAITYNKETSDARSSTVMLNIIRSAYRLPLQFTDMSTVLGTASSQGSLSLNLPFVGSGTATPMGSLSGGPTFTITNLNSQDFYQGVQSPIRTEVIGALLDQGVDPRVLFQLVFSKIEIIKNSEISTIEFDMPPPQPFEPPSAAVSRVESVHSVVLRLIQYGLYVKLSKKAKDDKEKDEYQFCFDPSRAPEFKHEVGTASNIFVTRNSRQPIRLAFANRRTIPEFFLPPGLNCKSNLSGHSSGGVSVRFSRRSLLGIYNYLGAISRVKLGLDRSATDTTVRFPDGTYFDLFNVKAGIPGDADPSATFSGQTYYVSTDPAGNDASVQVMQVLADLQALNSKANNVPAPGISLLAR